MKKLTKEEYFKKYGDEEIEQSKNQYIKTNYPTPVHRYRLVHETFQQSIEENYYWILNFMRYEQGYAHVEKLIDVFAASEHSAFFGVAQQRLGLQQDKVSQFLATIGKMVKELFQLVREIRVLDERLSYYYDSFTRSKSNESAEITLKGTYIDMVEGGAKNPASVYGMSRELQFTTLPDLFFSTHPKTAVEVDEIVDRLEFNRKVREVLKRKLRGFLEWKEHTFKELKNRRIFTLKYLRQHYDIIKLYMTWVRPYLRNIRRLQNESMEAGKSTTPDLISAFEGSLIEIEVLGKHLPENNKKYYACQLINFNYRTRPSMNYQQEGFQRGPLHVGENKIIFRGYVWNEQDIENYKKMRDEEDFELIGVIDGSVKAAMEALGTELERYLTEAGESNVEFKKEAENKIPKQTMAGPFVSVFKGFGELFGSMGPRNIGKKGIRKKMEKKMTGVEIDEEKHRANDFVKKTVYHSYRNFKKAHRMLSW